MARHFSVTCTEASGVIQFQTGPSSLPHCFERLGYQFISWLPVWTWSQLAPLLAQTQLLCILNWLGVDSGCDCEGNALATSDLMVVIQLSRIAYVFRCRKRYIYLQISIHHLRLLPSFFPRPMTALALLSLLVYFIGVGALVTPQTAAITNDGIHLAVGPKCGPLSGPSADVNAGIDLRKIKTIVSFGVGIYSWPRNYGWRSIFCGSGFLHWWRWEPRWLSTCATCHNPTKRGGRWTLDQREALDREYCRWYWGKAHGLRRKLPYCSHS